jgi:broad specificity phosphatase PhoE
MIKRSFYFLRHGETTENASGILEGHIDTVLNDRGRYQAQGAIDVLSHHPFDRIVCSPLKRAVETAEIINKILQKPIVFDDRLQEKSFGLFEGRTKTQIEQWKKKYDFVDGPIEPETGYSVPPQGETYASFRNRIVRSVADHLNHHSRDRILFISHGGVFSALHLELIKSQLKSNMLPYEFEKQTENWVLHGLMTPHQQIQSHD